MLIYQIYFAITVPKRGSFIVLSFYPCVETSECSPKMILRARLFKILDKVIHWMRMSTGQLIIQWTASRWIQLVVQKQRQWLATYPQDKMLSSG